MTVKELIAMLQTIPGSGNKEIMVLDGHNGGGVPREINFGPTVYKIKKSDADNTCDCENKIRKQIILLGYGCY